MAQYKRIPLEFVEHTELVEKSWKEYNHGIDEPDEATIESDWIADRKRLYAMLNQLTPKQRQVYIMIVGYGLTENKVAKKLNVTQQTVSYNYKLAYKKIKKILSK